MTFDLSSTSVRPNFEAEHLVDVMDFHHLTRGELAAYILEKNPSLHETLSTQQIEHFAQRDHLDLLRLAQSTFIEKAPGTVA